jgi:hypothetical protein
VISFSELALLPLGAAPFGALTPADGFTVACETPFFGFLSDVLDDCFGRSGAGVWVDDSAVAAALDFITIAAQVLGVIFCGLSSVDKLLRPSTIEDWVIAAEF